MVEAAFGTFKHDWNDAPQHRDSKKANLLILGHFAEVRDADSQISKCSMTDNGREMFLIEPRNDLKSGAYDALCDGENVVLSRG